MSINHKLQRRLKSILNNEIISQIKHDVYTKSNITFILAMQCVDKVFDELTLVEQSRVAIKRDMGK